MAANSLRVPTIADSNKLRWAFVGVVLTGIAMLFFYAVLILGARQVKASDYLPQRPCEPYGGDYGLNIGQPGWIAPEVDNLWEVFYTTCYNTVPPIQESGYTYVNHYASGYSNEAWAYYQQNPDGYVQEQLNGPYLWGPDGVLSQWYGYWQMNPPASGYPCGWFQEQVNTWSGGPYWHDSGGGYC